MMGKIIAFSEKDKTHNRYSAMVLFGTPNMYAMPIYGLIAKRKKKVKTENMHYSSLLFITLFSSCNILYKNSKKQKKRKSNYKSSMMFLDSICNQTKTKFYAIRKAHEIENIMEIGCFVDCAMPSVAK